MDLISYPLNGITYDAEDVGTYLCTRTSGVYSRDSNFLVTVTGPRQITVSPGLAWINYDDFKGISVCAKKADSLTVPEADDTLARIDRVVLHFDTDANKTTLLLKTGTPSATPSGPEIQQNHRIYELCLCEISVPAGSTTIVAGNITDTRLNPALCGVMRDGVTGLPTEELIASARERINALEETASAAAKEVDASKKAAAKSEANAKAYKEAAATSEHNAGVYASDASRAANAANQSASAAAGSATKAAGSASGAAESKTAAATSEANAAKHEEAAKKAADEAGAKAGTDKTLTIENAPADAAATGAELAKKASKDVILDEDGNVLFYRKTAMDELLAKKLDLTGGTMSGKILINAIGSDVIKISGSTENADEEIEFERTDTGAALACGIGAGGSNMGLFDRTNGKWAFHVKSTTGDVYIGGTKCLGFVVASGSNYVRFGDGTQICWGKVQATVTFPIAFATTSYCVGMSNARAGSGFGQNVTPYITTRTTTDMKISSADYGDSYIAIGRWK